MPRTDAYTAYTRLLLLTAGPTYLAWHWVYVASLPQADDSLLERVVVLSICWGGLLATYLPALRDRVPVLSQAIAYGILLHYATLAVRNDLAPPYPLGGVVITVIGLTLSTTIRGLVQYSLVVVALVGATIAAASAPAGVELSYALGTATMLTFAPFILGRNIRAAEEARRAIEAARTAVQQRIEELEAARTKVRQLEGLLSICMHCHKIKTPSGAWERVDRYVADHSEATFSHGLCPRCFEIHYPDDEVA